MAQRLGESIEELRRKDEQQRQFVADVAHDLRTPMAVLIAASDSLTGPDHDRSAELIATQSRRLSALVEDLLEMSRFDAGAAELRPEPVDLQELCVDVVQMVDADIPVPLLGDGVARRRSPPAAHHRPQPGQQCPAPRRPADHHHHRRHGAAPRSASPSAITARACRRS